MMEENQVAPEPGVAGADGAEGSGDAAQPRSFDEMGLLPEVKQALAEMGFIEPMPVQQAVFPRLMAGRDVMVQSRTGSGKTAAFGIPIAQGLIDPAVKQVQALALCPTRELALQVAQECNKIGQYRGLQVVPIYGGAPMGKQIEALKAGGQMVAGTPGRVLDHLRRGTLKLDGLKLLVLDEADEMLSMGFLEEITEIIKQCPKDRQTLLFSATIPDDIERIGSRYMREPEKVQLSADGVGAREIHHAYYMVSGMGRTRDLVRVIEVERPESAIIFCNTREDTALVAEYLKRQGYDAEAISSDLTQKDRERVMGRTKEKGLRFLVATDIAARGIDITDLSHVINYTFPESAEVYVHRTGRTGRAGKRGTAISLIAPRELGNFYMLKLTYKIKPEERTLPPEDQWKTVREAGKVEELKKQIGDRAVSEEWRAVARRLWTSEDGERYVAALIADRLQPERRRASDPEPALTALPASEPREPRAPRREEGPDERPRATNGAPAREAREPRGENGERRRRRSRSESRRVEREAKPEKPRITDTIDTSDGREFWEAWVDSKSEAAQPVAEASILPPPEAPAPRRRARTEGEPAQANGRAAAEPRPATPVPEGHVRLYLNLGRRDGLKEEEIASLLASKGVEAASLEVRNSHTYVVVPEAAEADVLARLNDGSSHDGRPIKAERAKK